MTRPKFRTPRLPEPLPAVLVGAGFFLFLAAFSRFGPFASTKPWMAPFAAPAAQAPDVPASAAESVVGAPVSGGSGAQADALARDLAWLRSQGAGLIVLEAWLDEPPQSDARSFEGELRARFEALPAGRARNRALQVLSATASELDAPQRLAAALKAAGPLLLAFQVAPGAGVLPDALKSQTYEVSLRGENKTLPDYQALRLPFDEALLSGAAFAALPPASADTGRVVAVVGIQGHWVDCMGLEAARLALGLPLQGLRYRWQQGALNSLELADRRYPMDAEGRLLMGSAGAALPSVSMDRLRQDPAEAGKLRGKTLFFRPWPGQLGEAQSFGDQARLFTALMTPSAPVAASSKGPELDWCLLGALAVVLGLAFAPVWGALCVWCLLTLLAGWFFQGSLSDSVQALAYAAAALMLGLGWRAQRSRGIQLEGERLLHGMVAVGHQVDWSRRLRKGAAALPGVYALVGPRALMRGALWEAWMGRWGALMDEGLPADGLGLILAEPRAAQAMAAALLDLRREIEGLSGALALGTLSLRVDQRLGAAVWQIQGPAKDRALELSRLAAAGQILLSHKDFLVFGDFIEARALVQKNVQARAQDPIMTILGPKTNLWERRP